MCMTLLFTVDVFSGTSASVGRKSLIQCSYNNDFLTQTRSFEFSDSTEIRWNIDTIFPYKITLMEDVSIFS